MKLLGVTLLLLSLTCIGNAFNITKILDKFPEYSKFNSYLTRTKLADEINSRQTITVLAVSNGAMGDLEGMPLSAIKRALSLHVVLDFFDPAKLHEITNGTTLTTTLYQTTGNAPGNAGFVNITDLKGGKVGFGTSAKGTKLDATYVKSIKQVGYNLSVIEVSKPITTDVAAAPAPSPTETNITAVLLKGGCKIFAGLLTSTGTIKTYDDNLEGGLTVFAPSDQAFTGVMAKLKKLTADDVVSVLEFHASPAYSPLGTLKTTNGHLSTLATGGGSKFALNVATAGENVVLSTGVNKATVASTLVDDQPLAVFIINKVLEPQELFTAAPAPAPAPEKEAPATSPDTSSPPAPAAPAESPVATEGPSADATSTKSFAPARCVGRGLQLILAVGVFGSLLLL